MFNIAPQLVVAWAIVSADPFGSLDSAPKIEIEFPRRENNFGVEALSMPWSAGFQSPAYRNRIVQGYWIVQGYRGPRAVEVADPVCGAFAEGEQLDDPKDFNRIAR